jgi:hypothetical protein
LWIHDDLSDHPQTLFAVKKTIERSALSAGSVLKNSDYLTAKNAEIAKKTRGSRNDDMGWSGRRREPNLTTPCHLFAVLAAVEARREPMGAAGSPPG